MAETTMKKISIVFVTETGKSFTLSMNYAAPTLAEPEGAQKVQALVDFILENQPFAITLSACEGAELISTTTADIELTPDAGV